jgi:hypothetical protein
MKCRANRRKDAEMLPRHDDQNQTPTESPKRKSNLPISLFAGPAIPALVKFVLGAIRVVANIPIRDAIPLLVCLAIAFVPAVGAMYSSYSRNLH